MNSKYVVRIVTDRMNPPMASTWLGALRLANVIMIHRDDETGQCFDLLPPTGGRSKVWAGQTAARLRSYGLNAVCAPRWSEPDTECIECGRMFISGPEHITPTCSACVATIASNLK